MQERFDIAIIGGGVVGLAILRRMSMAGYRCLLLERGADILSGASKGNSALLHTGFDAPPGSLELSCMKAGYEEYRAISAKLNLPLLETGAVVVGWTAEEAEKLPAIVAKAHKNGVSDVRLISATELRIREPGLSRAACEAVLVPGEHVIDPWSAPLAYAQQALSCGATIQRGCAVTGADFSKGLWQLRAGDRAFAAETVINAAGLYGDRVEQFVRTPPFSIKPRKGQFVVFDKPAARLVRSIILPVPTERTKGVVLFRTIFGNLAIGPTAEDTQERESASCDQPTLENLKARAIAMAPGLANIGVNAIYAGLRPATEHQDYVIEALPDKQWITVAGIRSTGLTGSLGIAQHVEKLQRKHFGKPKAKPPKVAWPSMPNLAEHRIRPYQKGGEIICHCEWVTRSEIEAALQGPLPARDLGGLKRRTRAMMGRCQGFNCGAEVRCMLEKAGHGTA
ncbi:MAG: NAD(P)/FAD-dependent oxidoreductase [Hyphomicrobiales bacterium]